MWSGLSASIWRDQWSGRESLKGERGTSTAWSVSTLSLTWQAMTVAWNLLQVLQKCWKNVLTKRIYTFMSNIPTKRRKDRSNYVCTAQSLNCWWSLHCVVQGPWILIGSFRSSIISGHFMLVAKIRKWSGGKGSTLCLGTKIPHPGIFHVLTS